MKVKLLSPPWRSVTQSCSTWRDASDCSDCVTCSANAMPNHMTCTGSTSVAMATISSKYKAGNTYRIIRDTCEPSPRRSRIWHARAP